MWVVAFAKTMMFSSFLLFSSVFVISADSAEDTHFYDLQEDGTILCDKKADCPADVPDQDNSTVLEFSCQPRAKVDLSWKPEEKADGTEPIIIIEDWYKEQTICGEEYVHVCCSQFNQTEPECKSYDVKNLCKDNSEVYGGVKPEEQLVVAQERVRVNVPRRLREKCERGTCLRRKRVKKIRGDQSLLSDSQGERRLRLPVEKKQKDQVRTVGQEY